MEVWSGVIEKGLLESETSCSVLIATSASFLLPIFEMTGFSSVVCCCTNATLPSTSSIVYEAHAGPIVGIIMLESDFVNHEENRVRMLLWSCHCFGGVTSSVLMKTSPVVKMGKNSAEVCSIMGVCATVPSWDGSRSVSGVGGPSVTIPA